MIEKWLLTSERTNERTNAAFCLWKRCYGTTSSVRPSDRPGVFLVRWMNDKMFTNERNILLKETTVRNQVVFVREPFSSLLLDE
jgi:hypothetical protein